MTAVGVNIITRDINKFYTCSSLSLYGDHAVNATAYLGSSLSDITDKKSVSISQSGTTVTVTFNENHLLGSGADYVIIQGTGIAGIDGNWSLASVTSTTVLTYTSTVSQTVTVNSAQAIPIKIHSAIIGSASVSASTPAVASTDISTVPIYILVVSAISAGSVVLDLVVQGNR